MNSTWPRWRPKPILNRSGQQAFWDDQAATYDNVDMTNDNAGELAIVQSLCNDFVRSGFAAEDVVTLGGASGCRDPLVVLTALGERQRPSKVVFNDLSGSMVGVAMQRLNSTGCHIVGIPGPIHEIADQIPTMPRRVIIGVYRAHALTEASPEEGQPHSGLEEYIRNCEIVGDHFIVEAIAFRNGIHEEIGRRIDVTAANGTDQLPAALMEIESWTTNPEADAIRVIGIRDQKPGFFISHWFTEKGVRNLVSEAFSPTRAELTTVTACAKGFVLRIDPVVQPRGILTILNNVLGNILPHEQVATLRAIHEVSA